MLFAIASFIWGCIDGRADANANPDPDRRRDLAMTWLLAGLVAGVLSGLVAWVISLFYKNVYAEGLISEVTTFAAFTALMVFVPGIIGVAIGRWLVDRQPRDAGEAPRPWRKRSGQDTDVFSAVRADDSAHRGDPRRPGAPDRGADVVGGHGRA